MSTPIYLLAIGKNNVASNLAWNARPAAETKAIEEQQNASLKEVGGKSIITCHSEFADEEHPWWTVERFPSLEARIEHAQTLRKIGWLDIVDAFTLLGTVNEEPAEVNLPDPLYYLWVAKSNPMGAVSLESYPKEVSDLVFAKHNAIYKENNSIIMLASYTDWCNEGYIAFGVDVYPNVEALKRVREGLVNLGWRRYFEGFSILGKAI